LAKLMLTGLKDSFSRNIFAKLSGLIAMPALAHLKNRMNPARYNGATLLGLNGLVVKSHGGTNELAFQYALEKAVLEVENKVVDLVRAQITDFVNQGLLL
jgi:glycerol-3-phosphate acyltransferase PlsX